MICVRKLVFAGALLAVVPFAAVAQDAKTAPKAEAPKAMPATPVAPAAPAAPAITSTSNGACGTTVAAPAAQEYRIVKKTVMVPTQVQETRTVNKPVQKTET